MEFAQLVFLLVLPVLGSAGISDDKRITSGYDAELGRFPFITSYQYNYNHYCAATIITPYWLYTAAHCIETVESISNFNIQNLRVVAGINNLQITVPGKQVKNVVKQFKHHRYNKLNFFNDIGLVLITGGFNFMNGVAAAPISIPDNSYLTIAGWGYRSSSNPQVSLRLQYAVGYRISNQECQTLINVPNAIVTSNMTCFLGYYQQTEASCNGDSGGPVLQQYPPNYEYKLIALIDWDVKPCGSYNKPSVGTLIYPYISWTDCITYYQNSASCTSF
ncbi:hypothetical protein FQR65_LT14268 [Abscondita terminalis]|nr:hypothetical protein FQR65_LT14268 [Abscondita terminalis]